MESDEHITVPDALMLLAPGCAHCPAVLAGLAELVKEGVIARLEVINIAELPERAAALGVRSVPWVRIGELELAGSYSLGELREWAQRAAGPDALAKYFDHLLTTGEGQRVEQMVRREPGHLQAVVELLGDPETGINARVGVGAVLESLQDSGLLGDVVAQLGDLADADDARIRADACHFLGLTGSAEAVSILEAHRDDRNRDVREIVEESLALLGGARS